MTKKRVEIRTLGCARNDVDSEELAHHLAQADWQVVTGQADVVLVNTCGFIEQAKQDSIETILDASEEAVPVVAVGCLAERYGSALARELPEAHILSFDDYPQIAQRLQQALDGTLPDPHEPQDRRRLLPITPVERADADAPGFTQLTERLISSGPSVSVKLASGCDRRCTFCAIPSFRGSFVSRRPLDIIDEVRGLVAAGVREVNLVSENSTSYGKDLGDVRLLESFLPELAETHITWIRLAYLQPAEIRPGLIPVMCQTPGVANYFDLSFQHASASVLRRMRRFGDADQFLKLLESIRHLAPEAGIRSNVIVGFPGETDNDVETLLAFLQAANMDAVGVFGYSDEEGTAAVDLPDHLDDQEVQARVSDVSRVVDELMNQRAEQRVSTTSTFLALDYRDGRWEGRCEFQGPSDGSTFIAETDIPTDMTLEVGDVVAVELKAGNGVDLEARLLS